MSKKIILLFTILIAILAGVVLLKRKKVDSSQISIGILQFASFPPLDEAKEGFISELKKEYGDKLVIIEQNAQGSIVQAQAIASSFKANENIKAFYAIATPAVQALKAVIKDRPILFAAVTDPDGQHLRFPGSNITGATDMADVEKQVTIIKQLIPNLRKISLLYNPGETNSVLLVKKMKEELTKIGIEFQENGVNSQADVAAATQNAVLNSQAVLVPTDNTIASAFPIVKQIADKAKIPLITTWTGEKDAPFMQFGVDYVQSGVQAADLLKSILNKGIPPMELQVISPSSKVFINSYELKRLNIVLPNSLKNELIVL
ncbi:ABC transporter substrate-binding protein [Pigmentibacter sp. JX0631]|uniref:ABC transporter substrate-binding protein n=1 Tax=Pigmentibacter sp. JX0631 TaxID=2976982 RepID=UPI0024690684|nr:ABC transporter substrate-binding protein [Pigmentibacter sp. JX0631]WGL59612.1 ABC transporter substrate-binding protein [Pigmentibacter sp. JX0631]